VRRTGVARLGGAITIIAVGWPVVLVSVAPSVPAAVVSPALHAGSDLNRATTADSAEAGTLVDVFGTRSDLTAGTFPATARKVLARPPILLDQQVVSEGQGNGLPVKIFGSSGDPLTARRSSGVGADRPVVRARPKHATRYFLVAAWEVAMAGIIISAVQKLRRRRP
jgi:hypothetical protein